MSRESKLFYSDTFKVQEKIKHYESFGWELLGINHDQVSMTRETQNPVYSQLVKYEYEYEDLCKQYEKLESQIEDVEFNFWLCLVLLVLCIFPAIIYIYVLVKRKKNNERIKNEMAVTRAKIEKVCNDSRAEFFAKQ